MPINCLLHHVVNLLTELATERSEMGKGDPDSRLCVPEPPETEKTSPDMNQPEPVVQQDRK